MAGKLHSHLSGNVMHFVKHASDGKWTKGGNQDTMSLAPIGLFVVGSKETVVNAIAHLAKNAV